MSLDGQALGSGIEHGGRGVARRRLEPHWAIVAVEVAKPGESPHRIPKL